MKLAMPQDPSKIDGGTGPTGWARAAQLGAFFALMMGICWVGIALPREMGHAAPLWPANAFTLVAVISSPRRRWTGWIAAAMAANLLSGLLEGASPVLAAAYSLCNAAEVLLSALLLRRFVGRDFDVSRIEHLVRLFLLGGVVSPFAIAPLAMLAAHFSGGDATAGGLATWATADGLGTMIAAPLLLTARDARRHLAERPKSFAGLAAVALFAAVTLGAFQSHQQVLFLIPAAMLLVVFQLQVVGAAVSVLIVVAVATGLALTGQTPADGIDMLLTERLIVAQLFLAAVTLSGFLTAAVLAQRQRLAAALREQFQRVSMAEEVAGVGYWRFDYVTKTLEWSKAVRDAYAIDDTTTDGAIGGLHPEDRETVVRQIREVREGGPERSLHYRLVRPDGEVRHVLGKACREHGPDGSVVAVFGAFFDMTELRRAQDELAEREARYRLLADSATDIVLKVDASDVITYISPSARRYGYEPEDLIGKSGFSLVHPDDQEKLRGLILDLFSGGEVDPTRDRSYRVRAADGTYNWMEGNPAIIRDEAGHPTAVVSQLRDITQRKVMEAELHAAREAAEAAAAVKADFMANMSHELRTPLTSVLGFTRLALDQPELSPTTREHIAKASNAGAALLTTVNDILDFSRLESGQLQVRPQPCDADAICRSTLELFSAGADAKGVQLAYEAQGLPGHVLVDPDRLRQVLLNLIGNAVKFSDEGVVTLSVAWREADQRLQVSVKDQGPGIAPEQQSLLFRRFSQVDGSATRRHGGTGLGLAICLGLVEAMGGAIGVESRQGEGARFFFDLPAEPCAAPEAVEDGPPAIAHGVRVLVADDHAVNRELVRAILTPLGAEITDAANGVEAVAAASRAPFDLILMDLRMPELDGLGAMTAIRAGDGPNRDAPILAFSAGADEPGAEERRAAGFDADLSKPILPLALMDAVARHARVNAAPPKRARKTRTPTKAKVAGTKA